MQPSQDNNHQQKQEDELITIEQVRSLCLSKQQQQEELILQKKSGVTGSMLDRPCKFNQHILQQLKNKKVDKQYLPFKRVLAEAKGVDTKNWYTKGGDMARLELEFDNRTQVFVYMKDMNYALKWQRYLVIERVLQMQTKLVAHCFENTKLEYKLKFEFQWVVFFQKAIEHYASQLNTHKKQSAKLDVSFLTSMDRAVLQYQIKKWKLKSDKQYQEELLREEQLAKLSLQEKSQLEIQRKQREAEEIVRRKRREEMASKVALLVRTKDQEIKSFSKYWQSRADYAANNRPLEFQFEMRSMLVQQSVSIMRPVLEVIFTSERNEYTADFGNIKTVGNYQYSIEESPYFRSKMLAFLSEPTQREYFTWNFREGLLGLCGLTKMTVSLMGYQDYIDLRVVDSLQQNQYSQTTRLQLQDLYKYTQQGRTVWIPLQWQKSKLFVEIVLSEPSTLDPLHFDILNYVQLNTPLRKVALKIIEQRTISPITETIKFSLELDKYTTQIQNLYQRFYIQNICLQPACMVTQWFAELKGQEEILLPVIEILKRNYLEFVEQGDCIVIYQQVSKIPNLRLPLLKDVKEYLDKHKFEDVISSKLEKILNAYMIYTNLRGIQLNVAYLSTLFTIASKIVIMTHYHSIYKGEQPVFGNRYDQEAQSFWLFVAFTSLLRKLHLPIYKSEDIHVLHEVVMSYIEIIHKELVAYAKINKIELETVFSEILTTMFTSIIQSQPLYNIWNLIIIKCSQTPMVLQLVLITLLNELGDKALLCQNTHEFYEAIKLQAQLMDIHQLEVKLGLCEQNLQQILNVQVSMQDSREHSNIHKEMAQDK